MERALETIELFAHFCRATGIDDVRPVATSAIRDATNRDDVPEGGAQALGPRRRGARARGRGALRLPGGGQLDDARRRRRARPRRRLDAAHPRRGPRGARRPLVAARRGAHDRALPVRRQRQAQAAQGAARARGGGARHRRAGCRTRAATAGAWPGIGGTVRNLAAAAEIAADKPSFGVQGFLLERGALDDLVERFADMSPEERGEVPGIKPERGDLILAGSVVIQSVMEIGGVRRARGDRGRPARGRLLLDAARGPRPAAVRGRAARERAQPRRLLRRRLRPRRARRGARARDVGRARRRPACTPATTASATCCGRRRCSTTSARRSTTTTTTSTRAT